MGPSLPGDWLTITPSKALVHSHPYVHEDLGPSLAPVNEIGPSVAADHSNAVARINRRLSASASNWTQVKRMPAVQGCRETDRMLIVSPSLERTQLMS